MWQWAVENEGVAPDIEVRNDPAAVIAGGDPQLETAVREAWRLLQTERVILKEEPAPPVRWRGPGMIGVYGAGTNFEPSTRSPSGMTRSISSVLRMSTGGFRA